jgi:acetyl esterase/lipase
VVDRDANVLPFPQANEAIELRHLRSFVAVAEELNFSRAAERLHLSQPALSRQIRHLERLVACELVSRSTHHVELTLAGEALLERARTLLRDVDEAVATTQAVGGELVGRVARLWEPIIDVFTGDRDLDDTRAAFEALHAQFDPPPEIRMQAVNAGGVSSLLLKAGGSADRTALYLHGGGYVLGSALGYRHLAGALAAASGADMLVADYRLGPEHPFPAALDDALSAYTWLVERSGPPAGIAGESTGAGLALSLLLALRDRKLPLPACCVLLCPLIDLSWTIGPAATASAEAVAEMQRRFTDPYLAGHPLDDPLVSPLSADLTGLPPMLVQAATGDAMREHAHLLVERAQDHGVDARLELHPTATHAFQTFWSFVPEAADAVHRAGGFIARADAVANRDTP